MSMRSRLPALLVLFAASLAAPPAAAQGSFSDRALGKAPAAYAASVKIQLGRAGDNAIELERALIASESDEEAEAAAFLIANMPYVDLVRMRSDVLREHVVCALEARRRFPWAAAVPHDLYLDYVLPYRNSQEPIERWRKYFMDELTPLLKDVTDPSEAAIAVNRWCGAKVKYKSTARRDQGPFETLRSGYGRCEEMVIFAMAAYRAVGIPYRQVWTPWWSTGDDNHAWAEVWVNGKWWPIGACEPRDALGEAWFNDATKRAALVLTYPYNSKADPAKRVVVSKYFEPVDVTANYTPTGLCRIRALRNGVPVPDAGVSVNVMNYGALRALAGKTTDKDGSVEFELGGGTYYVYAGGADAHTGDTVIVTPGQTVNCDLELNRGTPDTEFWLLYGRDITPILDTSEGGAADD
jgi:hypothetical protein